ncbi:MAG: MOSC domain-containing protein [Blastocatellia bacterium]
MIKEIGRVKALYRYPVKSMACEPMGSATLGWHGFAGDRRFAFVRKGDMTGFPWLTAGKYPLLVRYVPFTRDAEQSQGHTLYVRTPAGRELELRGAAIQEELSNAFGSQVELMQLDTGVFDEGNVSIISQSTISAVQQKVGMSVEAERFRPNIVIETADGEPFEEDGWLGKILHFGGEANSAAVNVYMRDVRCMMINLDPSTGEANATVLKAVARMNENCAGVYATATKIGRIAVGDKIFLQEI